MWRALSLLLLGTTAYGASDFSYNRCNGATGPSKWGGACQNVGTGTPIDLCNAKAFTTAAPTIQVAGYSTSRKLKALNNGYTIQIEIIDNWPTLQAGTLSNIVGKTTNTSAATWMLAQMHVHFGRTGLTNEGSEHYLQGKAYPMEAHFVHFNTAYGSTLSAAVSSGKTDALLVVGVFLQIGTSGEPATITNLGSLVSSLTKTSTQVSGDWTLSDLYDGSGAYYSYSGGLTTPTCDEIVTWVVIKTPKTITTNTLNLYKAAVTNPKTSAIKFATLADGNTQGQYGNYRPLQKVGSRTVYSSDGATAACTAVTEPSFACTASPMLLLQPSFLLSFLALGFALSTVHH